MIKEIWLVSNDGILIKHSIIKKSVPIDPDLIGALMSALQSFSVELTGKTINYIDIAGDERLIYIPFFNNRFFLVARIEFEKGERAFLKEVENFRFLVTSTFTDYETEEIIDREFGDGTFFLNLFEEPFMQVLDVLKDYAIREEERIHNLNIDSTKKLDFFNKVEKYIENTPYNLFILDRYTNELLFHKTTSNIFYSDHTYLLKILNEIKFSIFIKENLNKIAFTNGSIEVIAYYSELFVYILVNTECQNSSLISPPEFPKMAKILLEINNEESAYFNK
ncbi:MAG: roadblock/LC7 domain-containing protein [Candidatus Heimdallarchaeum endolithica]|uniref:Roadblock/LC7 domain-containing protein n=1 Tax=Candidatus Heimdallarchaeum endolithica TaxID=2876572 RepID=A0A9Y1FPL3_9ARCH|nr:MAG: roadblock/LC7 domain-containing protein [Candidatus Heimdallarchaeum endolithica]